MLASSPAWAYQKSSPTKVEKPKTADQPKATLEPRQPLPKAPYVSKPPNATRLVVKFRDDVKARVQPDNTVQFTASVEDDTVVTTISQQFNLKFVAPSNIPEARLQALETKAAAYSGKAQPDLAGIMYVDGPDAMLEAAANALQSLDTVEWAYFQVPWRTHQVEVGPGPGEPTGACCLPALPPDPTCDDSAFNTQTTCDFVGGIFIPDATCATLPVGCPSYGACCTWAPDPGEWGCSEAFQTAPDGSTAITCDDIGGVFEGGPCDEAECEFECGDEELASCFVEHPYPFCDDLDCCELVVSFREECGDTEWDFICVALANFYCTTPPGEPDPCNTPLNTSCFVPHNAPGCITFDCCHAVCDIDPFCCSGTWDIVCVAYAWEVCEFPTGKTTPDLTSAQGYLRTSSYANQFQGPPPAITPPLPPDPPVWFPGWAGQGMNLFSEGPIGDDPVRWIDDPSMPAPQRYQGLYGLGRELNEVYGVGPGNLTRGETVKVAVIEWAYYQDHEDLNVISEPGQTLIMIPDVTEPDHATACLGIINGQDNGFGVVGIAPDVQAYFFPLTSVEEGPRHFAAFVNCIDTLDPGDVISCSFGPGAPYYNLNNEPLSWTLLRMATDLGITACVSAGNDCQNLDDVTNLGESGAIVVGACTPGLPYCRLEFSNYFRSAPIGNSNVVHVCAWGTLVTSTGYGDLFWGGSNARSYTSTFGGTSAAAPQAAGVAACLQGLAKQFYNIPLPPSSLRSAIRGGGFPQCGVPDTIDAIPGFNPEADCGPDIDDDAPGNRIGPYLRPRVSAANILSQAPLGFDQSPNVKDVFILRGMGAFGNVFSFKASDNAYFVMQSQMTEQTVIPALQTHIAEANLVSSQARYLFTGFHSDLLFRIQSPTKQAGTITVNFEVLHSQPFSMLMMEIYDWTLGRWSFLGFQYPLPTPPQGTEVPVTFTSSNATRFINQTSKNVWIRGYVLTFANPLPGWLGPETNPQNGPVTRFDWLNATFSTGFNQPLP